jgi:dUTP pyrophosphatase
MKILSGKLSKTYDNDAGLDVHASKGATIPAESSALISTGLVIAVPNGHVGLLKSRSGLSVKYSLEVGAGVIDSGYRGEVKVHLYNHGHEAYKVNKGDKIAQLITIPINLGHYEKVSQLVDAPRSSAGFGSTGT